MHTVSIPENYYRTRIYKSSRCGLEFKKYGPSEVEKCPICQEVVYDRNIAEDKPLNPYSQTKLRWYTSPGYHLDEIRRREIVTIDGKKHVVIRDEKGHKIDYMPDLTVHGDMGKNENVQKLTGV